MDVWLIVGLSCFVVALLLLLHHGWSHRDCTDPGNFHAQEESCAAVCYFQLSDIRNHETWILVLVAVGVAIIIVSRFLLS